MKQDTATQGLKLLDDRVFDPEKDKDAFHHEIYSNVLKKIFDPCSGNRPGISVGLFGKWGQGKSSIVEMLSKKLKTKNVEIVIFNAWQTRGDSVRRQMAISILEALNPKKADSLKRHTGSDIPEVFDERAPLETACAYVKAFVSTLLSPVFWVCAVFSLILVVAILLCFALAFNSTSNQRAWLAVASLLSSGASFAFFKAGDKIRQIFMTCTDSTVLSEHRLLRFPEQFAEVVSRYVAIYSKANNNKEILVVVDDLDRCDPETVVQALATIKQLAAIREYRKKKYPVIMRFLVPCDEKQVVLALEADGHDAGEAGGRYHDYHSEELLRKFFDVVVRMDQLIPEDMVSYSTKVLQEFDGVTPHDVELIQELIGAVAPRDPRQVKKLVNSYLIRKEKICELTKARVCPAADTLEHFDKSLLLVIAIHETLPELYGKIVEEPDRINQLSKAEAEKENDPSTKKAIRIVQALQPISVKTLRVLTRKGLPETLVQVKGGLRIYDAVLSGNAEDFTIAIAEADDLPSIVSWFKEYRLSRLSVAQFRHALTCMLGVAEAKPEILNAIDDLADYPRLEEALAGFAGLLNLALLSSLLKQSQQRLHSAVIANLCLIEDDTLMESDELKASFVFGKELSDSVKKPLVNKLTQLLKTDDAGVAQQRLRALKKSLQDVETERYRGFAPGLALSIATHCSWGFYSTKKPKEDQGLHSNAIVTLAGEDDATLEKIVAVVFKPEGPLGKPINLQQDSDRGEYEALLTLQKIAARLPGKAARDLYTKLKSWIDIQPASPHAQFRHVCNAMRSALFMLTDEQLTQFSTLLVDRTKPADDPEWLCQYVERAPKTTDAQKQKYASFCKAIFNRIAETQLTANAIPEPLKKLLAGVAENGWDVATEADAVLAAAVSRMPDEQTWKIWKSTLWPLCGERFQKTTQAVHERIKKADAISSALITFAVKDICKNELTHALQTVLKDYFINVPKAVSNNTFIELFKDENIEGSDKILEFVINALQLGLNDAQLLFLAEHCPEQSRNALFKFMQINYIQSSDTGAFSKGLQYIKVMGNPPDDVLEEIKKHAIEQKETLSDEDKAIVIKLCGEDIFVIKKVGKKDSNADESE